jgi:hypothetical protein
MIRTLYRARLFDSALFGAILCGLLGISPVSQGATLMLVTYNSEARPDCQPCTYNVWLQDGNFREEVTAKKPSDDSALFVDDTLILLKAEQHVYNLVDRALLEMVSPDKARMRQKLEAHTSSLSAAQRSQLSRYLNKVAPAPGSEPEDVVGDSGRTEVLAQTSYAVWERRHNGRKLAEFLVVPQESVPSAMEWRTVVQRLDRMTAGVTSVSSGEFERMFGRVQDLARVQGVPIYIRQFNPDTSLHSEVRFQFSAVKPMPKDWLQIPPEYRPDPGQVYSTPN